MSARRSRFATSPFLEPSRQLFPGPPISQTEIVRIAKAISLSFRAAFHSILESTLMDKVALIIRSVFSRVPFARHLYAKKGIIDIPQIRDKTENSWQSSKQLPLCASAASRNRVFIVCIYKYRRDPSLLFDDKSSPLFTSSLSPVTSFFCFR